jgi:signal peptidase II
MLVREKSPMRWPVMLFLSGATGNSIDRTFFGKVTDFVDVDFPDIIIERWPVFNLADSCVTIGIVLVLLLSIRSHRHHSPQSEPNHDRISDSPETLHDHDGSRSTAAAD